MLARSLINVDGGFLENLMVLESLSCRPGIPAGDPPRPLTGPTLECPSKVLIEPHQQRDSG